MAHMKKKQRSSNSIPGSFAPKGNKLPYEKLRGLVLDTIVSGKSDGWSARQLIKKLKIANSKTDVAKVLDSLAKQGKVSVDEEGVYKSLMAPKVSDRKVPLAKAVGKNVHTGIVDLTRSGSAYVIVDGMDDDIFVSPRNVGGAMNRDRVEVEIVSQRRGRKPEGRIVNVVKRNIEQVMGTLRMFKSFAVVVPDRSNIRFDVIIPTDKVGEAVDGDKVVAKI